MIDGDVGELPIGVALKQEDKLCPCIEREPTYYFGADPGETGD